MRGTCRSKDRNGGNNSVKGRTKEKTDERKYVGGDTSN